MNISQWVHGNYCCYQKKVLNGKIWDLARCWDTNLIFETKTTIFVFKSMPDMMKKCRIFTTTASLLIIETWFIPVFVILRRKTYSIYIPVSYLCLIVVTLLHSFGLVWINAPSTLWLWRFKGTVESLPLGDSSVLCAMHHDPCDLGSMILFQQKSSQRNAPLKIQLNLL